jgi:hypothetical protein
MRIPFRGFSAILYKEFLVVFRDPLTLFFMFVPPLIQLVAFGFALDTDVKHIATLVFDPPRPGLCGASNPTRFLARPAGPPHGAHPGAD